VNREELKTRLMAEAEAAMDDLLARKPEAAEIKLRDIELIFRTWPNRNDVYSQLWLPF
jgi:ribosomal 50S subunit-associated protein YjgA (DUF615 family)